MISKHFVPRIFLFISSLLLLLPGFAQPTMDVPMVYNNSQYLMCMIKSTNWNPNNLAPEVQATPERPDIPNFTASYYIQKMNETGDCDSTQTNSIGTISLNYVNGQLEQTLQPKPGHFFSLEKSNQCGNTGPVGISCYSFTVTP